MAIRGRNKSNENLNNNMKHARLTYRKNKEMFDNRNEYKLKKNPDEMSIGELEELKKDIENCSREQGGDYVLVPWIGPVRGPIPAKDSSGPKTYCFEMRKREDVEDYYKRLDASSMEWDPHMGAYWDVRSIDARIYFLKNGRPSNADFFRKAREELEADT
ncbi:MAG: hypothetical protein ACE5J7_05275 [Candidatus Aenigmatarchaeota archaeon]